VGYFEQGFRSSDRRQYSESLLRDMGVTLLLIVTGTDYQVAGGSRLVTYADGGNQFFIPLIRRAKRGLDPQSPFTAIQKKKKDTFIQSCNFKPKIKEHYYV
jgi:hypothetical protein